MERVSSLRSITRAPPGTAKPTSQLYRRSGTANDHLIRQLLLLEDFDSGGGGAFDRFQIVAMDARPVSQLRTLPPKKISALPRDQFTSPPRARRCPAGAPWRRRCRRAGAVRQNC